MSHGLSALLWDRHMEMLANNTGIILFLVLGFGLFRAWRIGANDVANAMGTSVG